MDELEVFGDGRLARLTLFGDGPIVFMDQSLMLLAWCQLRTDYRSFRIDRIDTLTETDESFRPKRVAMLRDCVAKIEREVAAHGVG